MATVLYIYWVYWMSCWAWTLRFRPARNTAAITILIFICYYFFAFRLSQGPKNVHGHFIKCFGRALLIVVLDVNPSHFGLHVTVHSVTKDIIVGSRRHPVRFLHGHPGIGDSIEHIATVSVPYSFEHLYAPTVVYLQNIVGIRLDALNGQMVVYPVPIGRYYIMDDNTSDLYGYGHCCRIAEFGISYIANGIGQCMDSRAKPHRHIYIPSFIHGYATIFKITESDGHVIGVCRIATQRIVVQYVPGITSGNRNSERGVVFCFRHFRYPDHKEGRIALCTCFVVHYISDSCGFFVEPCFRGKGYLSGVGVDAPCALSHDIKEDYLLSGIRINEFHRCWINWKIAFHIVVQRIKGYRRIGGCRNDII